MNFNQPCVKRPCPNWGTILCHRVAQSHSRLLDSGGDWALGALRPFAPQLENDERAATPHKQYYNICSHMFSYVDYINNKHKKPTTTTV